MTLSNMYKCASALFKARFFGKKLPLAVCWHLTYRCNYDCKYCGVPRLNSSYEMSTSEVFSVIDDLKRLGTRRIHFSGGESLLRDDIGDISDYCMRNSIEVGLISNGSLVPQYVKRLTNLVELRLSLDGPPRVQDELRGQGAYDRVMKAVEAAKRHRIRTVFSTTLTKVSLPYVEYMVEKGKELDTPVIFLPINNLLAGSKDIEDLKFSQHLYREKINYLLKEAPRNEYIINSISGLRHILNYPNLKEVKDCVAGKLFCHIKADGSVYPCERKVFPDAPNCRTEGIKEAFKRLPAVSCSQCWCSATLELVLIYSLNIRSIINFIKKGI